MKRFCIYFLTSVLLMCILIPLGFSQVGPVTPPFHPWPYYSGKNTIIAVTPTTPCSNVTISSETSITFSDDGTGITSVQYVDGLYRTSQSTVWDASHAKYLTTQTSYDAAGREYRQWLPLPNNANGGFVTNYESQAVSLYGANPYDETIWEQSPLNRDLGVKGPNEYYSHPSSISYQINTANEVKRLTVALNGVRNIGSYPAGTLQKTTRLDADHKQVAEYTDAFGRLVLSQQANSAYTYYVYNDLGQLAYVIPPLLADKMTNNHTYADTCADMRRFAYVYKYDTRGNLVYKRLPGCDPIYYVYDKGNRLVMTQDGNQRQRGHYWTVNKYDSINRPIYTFEVYAPECSSLEAAQQICTPLNFFEQYSPTGNPNYPLSTTGYSRNFFHVHPMNILTVNYYDNYSFLNHLSSYVSTNLTAQSVTGYDVVTTGSTQGLLTGQRVYNLKEQTYTTTAFYYDTRGRLVQQRSYNSWSGVDNTYYTLSFTGKPRKMKTEQTFSNITTTEEYYYNYDSQERLLATHYKLNDGSIMQLDSFRYDELGRVSCKYMLDQIDSVCYTYNIRSQITKLKSSGFEENVYYTSASPIAASAATPCYNGNASVSTWTYGNKTNGTMYHYDDYNRLTYTYGIYDGEWVDMYYSENFSYDKQGNILSAYRMANEDELDMLNLTYEGNQLIKVTDYAEDGICYSAKHYQDYENAQKEMFYDKNGALIADLDRKICTIRNNLLTLPDTIQFTNGNQIVHHYNAMGNRLRTTYYTRKVALVEPACTTLPGTDNLQEYNIVSYTMLGNKRYIKLNDSPWFLDKVMNDEGYTRFELGDEDYPFYYIKDHLGNIRETYVRTSGNKFCAQRMQYYPSGLPWDESQGASEQPFKYGSKEFIEMHGLDEYDSQARWYYPAIMRTTTMDPMCEKYYSTSPYAWCSNNPVNFVDPDGRDWYQDSLNNIVWTNLTSQMAMDEAGLTGKYLGEVVLDFEGSEYEFLDWKDGKYGNIYGEGAITANVTMYGPDGPDDITTGMVGFTMSSDYSTFGAIEEGWYVADYKLKGKSAPLPSHWLLTDETLHSTKPGYCYEKDGKLNMSPQSYINFGTRYKTGIYIHSTNQDGFAGITRWGENKPISGVSVGCLLLTPQDFKRFNAKAGRRQVKVRVSR